MELFQLRHLSTNTLFKQLTIEASLDIDPDSMSFRSVEIVGREMNNIKTYDWEIVENRLILTLRDWPTPNAVYIVKIQNLRSIMGEELSAPMMREIVFKSSVTSRARIVKPFDFQRIDALTVHIEEQLNEDSQIPVGRAYVEIATDNHFYSIVDPTTVVETGADVFLGRPEPKQYFLRARIQEDTLGEYGPWSEVYTFVITSDGDEVPPDEIDGPVIKKNLEIINYPEHNFTGENWKIKFDHTLNPDQEIKITVRKRRV